MKPSVSRVSVKDLKESLLRAVSFSHNDTSSLFTGRRVLIKANFNSPHRYPASSDPAFLASLASILKEAGAAEILIGDSCGLKWQPAAEVHRKIGLEKLCRDVGAFPVNFDNGPWKKISIGSRHFRDVEMFDTSAISDKLVYSCCMKTHSSAGFSLSLKHTVGLLSAPYRQQIHLGNIEEKIACINMAVKPDLILIDARKCFVSGGPAAGLVRRPGLILASTNRVAIDVEGIRVLTSLFGFNKIAKEPRDNLQIAEALSLRIDDMKNEDYELITE